MACCQQAQPWPKECRVAKGHLTQGTEQHPLICYIRIEGERNECYKKAASKVTKRGAQRPLCTRPIGDFSVCIFIWSGGGKIVNVWWGFVRDQNPSPAFFLLSISTDLKLLQFVFTPHNRRRVIRREKTHKCRRASFFGLKLSHFFFCTQVWPSKFFEANRFLVWPKLIQKMLFLKTFFV